LYSQRVNVEVDIRNLKVVLDTENIRAKKVDTFLKELYTSVVAYNLVGQFRRQAAELNQVAPRRMSFKRTWTTFQTFLLRHLHTEPELWREAFERALFYATKDKLPNRAANRSVKREVYPKRSKRDQFEKRKKPPEKFKHTDLK
ncbi:MAG: IS4 family transposase, partial [Planctomycetaceae bacterium]|nr:IS4 family transposase [Planctomycetaceae bacterium]